MIKLNIIVLLTALVSSAAYADDYVISVNGLVCEFCAIGVTKKVAKLPFIDNSKYTKGVKVEIKDQLVTIAVLSDAEVNKEALFSAIEAGGYSPVELWRLTSTGERIPL